jgi:hypothetical protein
LDKVLTVRDIGQLIKGGDISLVSRRGGSRLPGIGLVSIAPSYKIRSAYYKETLIGNAKRLPRVVMGRST